jgi:hypothetical protein
LGSSTSDDELEIYLKDNKKVKVKIKDDSETLSSNIELTDGLTWSNGFDYLVKR